MSAKNLGTTTGWVVWTGWLRATPHAGAAGANPARARNIAQSAGWRPWWCRQGLRHHHGRGNARRLRDFDGITLFGGSRRDICELVLRAGPDTPIVAMPVVAPIVGGIIGAGVVLLHWVLTRFAVRCSLFAVRCSLFAVRCSLFAVRCSLFAVRCSLFAVRDARLRKMAADQSARTKGERWQALGVGPQRKVRNEQLETVSEALIAKLRRGDRSGNDQHAVHGVRPEWTRDCAASGRARSDSCPSPAGSSTILCRSSRERTSRLPSALSAGKLTAGRSRRDWCHQPARDDGRVESKDRASLVQRHRLAGHADRSHHQCGSDSESADAIRSKTGLPPATYFSGGQDSMDSRQRRRRARRGCTRRGGVRQHRHVGDLESDRRPRRWIARDRRHQREPDDVDGLCGRWRGTTNCWRSSRSRTPCSPPSVRRPIAPVTA